MTPEEIADYNAMLRKWGNFITKRFAASAARFTDGKQGAVTRGIQKHHSRTELKLDQSMKNRADMHFGMVDYIGFNFERHGVFVHKGVGRGYSVQGGMVVRKYIGETKEVKSRNKNSYSLKSRPRGVITRKKEEWFNPVLNAVLPGLADRVAEMNADAAVNATKMFIK